MINEIISKLKFGIMILVLFSSCSMEKRHYNSGYHIDWKKDQKSVQEVEPKKNDLRTEDQDLSFHSNTAGVEPASLIPVRTDVRRAEEQFINVAVDKCDLIVLQNGTEIKAVIHKVGDSEIIYKICPENKDGKYSIQKSKVFMIRYQNGKNDTINIKKEITENLPDTAARIENKQKQPELDTNALISFLSALLIPFVYFTAPVAIIFGFISLSRIRRSDGKLKGRGLAIAGIVLGLLAILVVMFYLALLFAWGISY